MDPEGDVLADDLFEHAAGLVDRGVEIGLDNLDGLFAAESEKLLGQFGGLLRGADNTIEGWGRVLDTAFEPRGMAANDREEIREIVGDAASQTADRFHFLRLEKLRFERTLTGNVDDESEVGGALGK